MDLLTCPRVLWGILGVGFGLRELFVFCWRLAWFMWGPDESRRFVVYVRVVLGGIGIDGWV